MKERRQHPRYPTDYTLVVFHPELGIFAGKVENMSDSGVYIATHRATDLSPQQPVEALILGEGWDESMPSLTMQVIRVDPAGLALAFTDTLNLQQGQQGMSQVATG